MAIMLSHNPVSERLRCFDQRAELLVIVDHQHLRGLTSAAGEVKGGLVAA
jgi:hypothetical protein